MLRKCGSILKINNVEQTMNYWITKLEFTPMLLHSLWSAKTKIKIIMSVWCLLSLHLLWLPNLAAEILMQTSFEEFLAGKAPKDWKVKGKAAEVATNKVKTGKKSLAVLGGADGDGTGVAIETQESITSVEFWIYVKGGGRSINLKAASADNIEENNGGPYINWNAGMTRFYDGAAWNEMDKFDTDKWKYVRVVSDFKKSEFQFFAGDNRDLALNAKAIQGKFRNAALEPVCKFVVFYIWAVTAPAYVDDLLVYEGADAVDLAVEQLPDKLTTIWATIKTQNGIQ